MISPELAIEPDAPRALWPVRIEKKVPLEVTDAVAATPAARSKIERKVAAEAMAPVAARAVARSKMEKKVATEASAAVGADRG